MPGKLKYYWDTCIFLAWLGNEKRPPGEMEGIEETARRITANKADMFTSVATESEVLECNMTDEQKEMFKKLFQRKNVIKVDTNDRIWALSRKIREWNSKISLGDSLHLATAIYYEADEFHTTDGTSRRKRKGHLLPLDGNVAGHKLHICAPNARQFGLFCGVTPSPEQAKGKGAK